MNVNNFAVVKLEFLDSSSTVVGSFESDSHHDRVATGRHMAAIHRSGNCPANTSTAQIVLVHVQLANPVAGGSIFFDDAALGTVPEPASVVLGMLSVVGTVGFARRRVWR